MCAELCVPCFMHAQLCMPFPGSCECMHNCVCLALCPGEHYKVPGGLPTYLEQPPDCNSETTCPLWLRGVDFPGSSMARQCDICEQFSSVKMYCRSGKGSQILPLFSYHFIGASLAATLQLSSLHLVNKSREQQSPISH